jgi:hypothetical protein
MVQKAQQHYQDDYQTNYNTSSDQSGWIWGGLAALAILGLAIWFMASTGPSTGTVNTAPPPAEQVTPAPEAPAAPAPEAAPAPAPAPANPPAQ